MKNFRDNAIQIDPNKFNILDYKKGQHIQFNCNTCNTKTYRDIEHISKYGFECNRCLRQKGVSSKELNKDLTNEPVYIEVYSEDMFNTFKTIQRVYFYCDNCGQEAETELRRFRNGKGLLCLGCSLKGIKKTISKPYIESPIKIDPKNFNKQEFEDKYCTTQKVEFNCVDCNEPIIYQYFRIKDFRCGNCSRKKTCQEKYGVPYNPYAYTEEAVIKRQETYKERTGYANPSQNPEIKQKKKDTCFEHYGTYVPLQSEQIMAKFKETCKEKYGVENVSQSEEIKEKKRETCLERYGYENYLMIPEIKEKAKHHKNIIRRYNIDGISFDSSWEVIFYLYYKGLNKTVNREPKSIPYKYQGETHNYYPDFEIDGQLYEVKGDQFFDIVNGQEVMINPYKPSENGLAEAKYQCMKENNVILIRREQIEEMEEQIDCSIL